MAGQEKIHDSLVQKAISFAEKAHLGVRRKDGFPYITHPLDVLRIMLQSPWDFTVEELAAAVLHDLVEDTGITFDEIEKEFGDRVAAMVWLLSKPKDKDKGMARKIYYSALRNLSPVLISIKLADMCHNLSTMDGVGVEPDWAKSFLDKINKYGLCLIKDLRMHGECWHEYADWIEKRMHYEIQIHGINIKTR